MVERILLVKNHLFSGIIVVGRHLYSDPVAIYDIISAVLYGSDRIIVIGELIG